MPEGEVGLGRAILAVNFLLPPHALGRRGQVVRDTDRTRDKNHIRRFRRVVCCSGGALQRVFHESSREFLGGSSHCPDANAFDLSSRA